ncbi:GNAT family N-acetyltransferase [Flaviaesturariibacter amylovorans]|uniref:GNAT family N-acetyltransferase n=1 Tax=Flaviaesturariibacter amylovorans TaxID=1084520 RepID=A0ABP8G5U4_9BACT
MITAHAPQTVLHTPRLRLLPLSYAQLEAYIRNDGALERELGLEPHPRSLDDALADALTHTILPGVAAAGEAHLFSTLWTIVHAASASMVGDLCFKGAPDAAGTVEIGYGTYAAHQGKGYMTEAVAAITQWALRQPGVTSVTAETEKANSASHRTLEKNGFQVVGEDGDMLWWRCSATV